MHSVKRSRVSLQFNIIILIMRLADHAINLDDRSRAHRARARAVLKPCGSIVKLLTPDGPNLKDK